MQLGSQEAKKGETPCPLPPLGSSHVIKDRCPLVSFDIGSHVLVHALVWACMEAAYVEGLFDSKIVFEIAFVFVGHCFKDVGPFNGSVTVLHVLG